MRFITSHSRWAGAVLGMVIGAAFGAPGGWAVAQLCLVALLLTLHAVGESPRRAAGTLAAFAACMTLAGHMGVALGTPAPVRVLALLPIAMLVGVQATLAWALGRVAFGVAASTAVRFVLLPSLWMLQEWLLSLSDVALPWLRLGYLQADGPLGGALPYGGVLLAGGLMLSLGGMLVTALLARPGTPRMAWATGAAALLATSTLAGGVQWTQPRGDLKVSLVQSGIDTEQKVEQAQTGRLLALYANAIHASAAELILTSQLAIPKTPEALPDGYLSQLGSALRHKEADAIIGMHLPSPDGVQLYNGVLALGHSGEQAYFKHQLFPFGEFLPVTGVARAWVQSWLPAPQTETARGPRDPEPLIAARHRLAMSICFEAAFAHAWRSQAGRADVLVNISSDSAIDSPQLSRQFKQLARVRALEFQKPLLRTSDVRGTYAIDAAGRVFAEWPERQAGVVHALVHTRAGLTPYARWGDGVPLTVATLALCMALFAARRAPCTSADASVQPPHRHGPMHQAGQVLPAAVALLLIAGAAFYLMVNAGQTVTEKIRVTNAADAAAYSAGVVEARALNFQAYINRAMVANQMAIAQMVSFASWVNYFAMGADHFAENAGDITFFMHPNLKVAQLDIAFGGTEIVSRYYGGRSVEEYARYIVEGAGSVVGIGALITAHDIVVQGLSGLQQAVQANLIAGIRQRQVAHEVVQAMDPALDARVVLVSHGFDTFTRNYARSGGSGDERGRFADVAMRSRDEFTRDRSWTLEGAGLNPFVSDAALKKRGGTDLVGFDEWRAVDTLELHGRRRRCGKLGLSWCDDIRRPIGWGEVYASTDRSDMGRGHHGNAYQENPTTAGEAEAKKTMPTAARFSGIPTSRDLGDLDPTHKLATGITLRVWKPHAATLTSGNAAQARPSGRLDLFNDRPAKGRLMALSRAEVFFDRIAGRADGKQEIASLYNPYWRVRLVAPTAADKAYAATEQDGLLLP